MEKTCSILETAILEMGRIRGDHPFYPTEVLKWIYPVDWKYFLPEIEDAMMKLLKEGKILIMQEGNSDSVDQISKGKVKIKMIPET